MADLTNALVAEKQPIAAARIQNLVEILLSRAEGEPTSVLMVLKNAFSTVTYWCTVGLFSCFVHVSTYFGPYSEWYTCCYVLNLKSRTPPQSVALKFNHKLSLHLILHWPTALNCSTCFCLVVFVGTGMPTFLQLIPHYLTRDSWNFQSRLNASWNIGKKSLNLHPNMSMPILSFLNALSNSSGAYYIWCNEYFSSVKWCDEYKNPEFNCSTAQNLVKNQLFEGYLGPLLTI